MNHTIEGKKFCITGTLDHYTRTTAQRAIMEAGGLIAKSVGPKTDFLVVGRMAGSKLTKATSLGIPVIEEADLESFLKGEVVEVDEQVVVFGDASVRDLIGEARAALDGHPDSATWSSIVEIVDSCAPSELGALVDFLEPQVSRWASKPTERWKPSRSSHGVEDAPSEWFDAIPSGELRVAPHHWIVEMVTKHESPKYRLVHAVHLSGMRVTGAAAAAILEREHLTNLRRLDVGENKLSATFWKKLRTLPSTERLEHLSFAKLDGKSIMGVQGTHHMSALRDLSFNSRYSYGSDYIGTFLKSDLAQGIQRLTMNGNCAEEVVAALADGTVMPELESLDVDTNNSNGARALLGSAAAHRIGRVKLKFNMWFYRLDEDTDLEAMLLDMLDSWTKGVQSGPEHLDLSGLVIDDRFPQTKHTLAAKALTGALNSWRLPPSTKTMKFGKWYSKDLEDLLAIRGVAATR